MDPDNKIIQLVTRSWETETGKKGVEIIGLGTDGLVYEWHRVTGKWILLVMPGR